MKVKKSKLPGVLEITLEPFVDFRGSYTETYNLEGYKAAKIKTAWLQDDISVSRRGVLRGIHGDYETEKLISCPFGEIYLVVVDCRDKSETFLKWEAWTVGPKSPLQVYVPAGCGVGHLVLSDWAVFNYKQSTLFKPKKQFTYKWNSGDLGIFWPVKDPILSVRDEAGRYV